jgi:hypothetical protein
MCSVSWVITDTGYEIFFNRDEQKTRSKALPPREFQLGQTKVLMPIDPVGLGSWISTNELGLSLCLLNNYQGCNPNPVVFSRGLLLKRLAKYATVDEVCGAFSQLNLPQFAPFTLLAFDPSICQQSSVMALEWNGRESNIHPTDSPLFSSGVDLNKVVQYRQRAFEQLVGPHPTRESLLAFHRHHHPEHRHLSVCMHRDDAESVSFTHVVVSAQSQEMRYIAGLPCAHLTTHALQQATTILSGRVLSTITQ